MTFSTHFVCVLHLTPLQGIKPSYVIDPSDIYSLNNKNEANHAAIPINPGAWEKREGRTIPLTSKGHFC